MTSASTRRLSRYVGLPVAAVAIAGTTAFGLAATSNAAPQVGNNAGQVVQQAQPPQHNQYLASGLLDSLGVKKSTS